MSPEPEGTGPEDAGPADADSPDADSPDADSPDAEPADRELAVAGDVEASPTRQLLGDFVLYEELGEGGSAVVYRALNRTFNGVVALKRWRATLSEAHRRKFLEECNLQWKLSDHPNIVRLFWADAPADEPPWLATELYEESLAQRLLRQPPLSTREALDLADDALAGLSAIHAEGMLHRDVKPANVLLKAGRAALGDLGITMRLDGWTRDGAAGTDAFLAPELSRGAAPTYRSDVYSAGVTIRYLLGTAVAPAVENVLTRATSHEPSDRPQDAGAFRTLLQKAAEVDAEAAATNVTTPGGPMWILAVDLGSSTTVAAARGEGQAAAVVDVDGQTRMPSVVFADAGAIITGEAAEQLGRGRPSQMLRSVKARIGDPVAPVLGGRVYPVVDLVAELLRRVYDEAVAQRGGPPREVRITHPANWNRPRVAQLVSAAVAAGLVNPIPVPEPIAAAAGTGHHDAAETGSLVAVYDLGGGTFDAAVLEVTATGYEVTGRPVGDSSIGGDLFDDLVMNALGEQLEPATWQRLQAPDDAEWATSAALCRTEARRVKEALSQHANVEAMLAVPTGLVRVAVTRQTFESLVEPYLAETVEVLGRAIADAESTATVASIYVVGGASRSPIVERLLQQAFPAVQVIRRGDPKASIALGAVSLELPGAPSLSPAPVPAAPVRPPAEPVAAAGAPAADPQALQALTAVTAERAVPQEPAAPRRRRISRRWLALTAAATVVVLGAGTTWILTRRPAPSPPPAADSVFQREQSLGTPRRGAAVAVVDGQVWALGGIGADGKAVNAVESYDAGSGLWNTRTALPFPLSAASAVVYHGELMVIGGLEAPASDPAGRVATHVWRLHAGRWEEAPTMGHSRVGAAAVVVADSIVVAGGRNRDASGSLRLAPETEVFDGKAWHVVTGGDIPTRRDQLAAASDGRTAFFVGGSPGDPGSATDVVEQFDPRTGHWTTGLPPMPRAGTNVSAVVVGDTMIASSELPTAEGGTSSLANFRFVVRRWSSMPALVPPRTSPSLAAVRHTLYVIGGAVAKQGSGEPPAAVARVDSLDLGSLIEVNAQWAKALPLPFPVQQAPSVTWPGHGVCVVGGLTDQLTGSDKVQCLAPGASAWAVVATLPAKLNHAMAVIYQGRLVVIGGFVPEASDISRDPTAHAYQLKEDRSGWDPLPDLAQPRAAGAAVVVGDSIVVAGGRTVDDQQQPVLVRTTEIYDGSTWRVGAPMTVPRDHLGGVSDGRYAYFVGGRRISADRNVAALERYDPATDTWKTLARMPRARGGLGAALVGTWIVTAGGEEPASADTDVEAYDIATGAWFALNPLLTPRHGAAVGVLGQAVYVMGGGMTASHLATAGSVEILDLGPTSSDSSPRPANPGATTTAGGTASPS